MLEVRPVLYRKNAKEVKELLLEAFPPEELMPFPALMLRARSPYAEFLSFYDEGQFCGLSYVILDGNTTYILFLATNGKIRSKGYGSQILAYLHERWRGNQISLDIEEVVPTAANYDQRVKRKQFYFRNGYEESGYLLHEGPVTYETLCYRDEYSPEGYNPTAYDEAMRKFSLGFYKSNSTLKADC